MLDAPRIVESEARLAAVIRLTIPRADIVKVMCPAIEEIMSTLAAQGIAPAGPVFSRHFRMDPDVFDFEIGVPVAARVARAGRVGAGELPAAKVVRTLYRGPYEGLGQAWCEFNAWITEQGIATDAGLWESYVAGPESSPDPGAWCTELNRPLGAH